MTCGAHRAGDPPAGDPAPPLVISASRRTDIPAFYMPWFMGCIRRGHFDLVNPFNRRQRRIPADPGRVHTIVFWSKNVEPLLARGDGEALAALGYRLFFHVTLNSADDRLEPHLPPLADRLAQLAELTRRFGPQRVTWRFDPICVWRDARGNLADNCGDFDAIARSAAACGVTRCVTSFVDLYAKVRRRLAAAHVNLVDPPLTHKVALIGRMVERLTPLGIDLSLCCEREVLDALPAGVPARAGACIDHRLLMRLNGGGLDGRRDRGQRVRLGCGCMAACDVGRYDRHPCPHGCLFCYANPALPRLRRAGPRTAEP